MLQVHPQYLTNEDARRWVEYHGIKLRRQPSGAVFAYISARCRHLTEDGLCGVYGTPDRPQVCANWPLTTQLSDITDMHDFFGEEFCDYAPKESE